MTQDDDAPVLSIGAVLGDSDRENMEWKRAIGDLRKRVQAARVRVVSPLNLNVVFHVDGRLAPNEFTGVRTGRFSAKAAHLMVQAAVQLGPVEDREEVLMSLLSDAINVAEEFARKKKVS